jgi:putative sigma-54 modulation protein
MEIQLTAKHLKVTPAIRDYVQQKMDKAQKYFDHIVWGQCFVFIEKRAHNCEIVIHAPGQTFRALAVAADLYSAVDLASDKIDAQLKKFKERIKNRHKASRASAPDGVALAPAPIRTIVVKQAVSPMSPEEAVEEMESLGHSFRLFQNKDSHQINLVYRGNDDAYRVLQPVKKAGR